MNRLFLGCLVFAAACASQEALPEKDEPQKEASSPIVQGTSLLGRPLVPRQVPPEVGARQQAQLEEALSAYRSNPGDPDAAIWAGRRMAYTGSYLEAIALFTEGIEKHPEDPRLYRHRGHRYITLRRFEEAVEDFRRAAELVDGKPDQVEPDGQPNAAGIPVSTLQSNIWYHLGLAHFLRGEWAEALEAYEAGARVSKNPDQIVSNTYWQVMTLWRLGRDEEAQSLLSGISSEMELIENHSYLQLLLLFKGLQTPEELLGEEPAGDAALENATLGFGAGAWHLREGRRGEALELWRRIIDGARWDAFGYIAAEAELAREDAGSR